MGTKRGISTNHFSQEFKCKFQPSPFMIVATKAAIIRLTIIFPNPKPSGFYAEI